MEAPSITVAREAGTAVRESRVPAKTGWLRLCRHADART